MNLNIIIILIIILIIKIGNIVLYLHHVIKQYQFMR